jgi:porphyrinogen peroxidase
MGTPQSGIFKEGARFLHALEFKADKGKDLAEIQSALRASLETTTPASVEQVLAFGGALWKDLAPAHGQTEIPHFDTIGNPNGAHAIGTQQDVLVWLAGDHHDDVLDAALAVNSFLASSLSLRLDQPGFVYRDSRDLTGFIDGTANPKEDKRLEAALVPSGLPGAGGAFVLSQKWVHSLASFNDLTQEEQERVIGRTKPDSIELQGDAMPADSHVSRTDVKQDGVALKIYRRSFPFGGASEHGLYFLAFSADPQHFDIMLRRMYGISEDKLHDRLTEFSEAITSSYWFAPSSEDLKIALG